MSVLDKIICYYPNKNSTTQGKDTNLLRILQSDKHKEKIIQLRSTSDEATQKQLKENLPCYTVAGRFNRRCEEGLLELSGLAAIDLDSVDQYDSLYILKHLEKDLDCVAYAGFSCRGIRLFAIVPFLYPDKYQRHYERLIKSFEEYNLPMGDVCHKIISQPRFVTWNENDRQFFQHDAKPYSMLVPEKFFYHLPKNSIHCSSHSGASFRKKGEAGIMREGSPENVFTWCVEQVNKSHSFIESRRHDYIMRVSRYCNIKGLTHDETLNGCLSYVQSGFDDKEISKIVRHVYKKHAGSHSKIPFIPKSDSSSKK